MTGARGVHLNPDRPADLTADELATAACLQVDPELFFATEPDNVAAAKRVCNRCPILERCRDVALASRDQYAILGATTPDERRTIKRRAARQAQQQATVHASATVVAAPAVVLTEREPPPFSAEHGTTAAWSQHVYRDETPCDLCRHAHNAYRRDLRARHRARRAALAGQRTT